MRVFSSVVLSLLVAAKPHLHLSEHKQAPGAGEAISGVTDRVGMLVQLLGNLGKDFDAEFKEAQTAYDKQACANEETITAAQKAIAAAEKRIEELNEAIEKGTADMASLSTIIKQLEADIAAKKKEIAEAIAKRKEEHHEYSQTVDEYKEGISSSHLAYDVLSKAQQSAQTVSNRQGLISTQQMTTQQQRKMLAQVQNSIRLLPLHSSKISAERVESMAEFLDDALSTKKPETSLLQFGRASDSIVAILKDMRGEFIAKLQGLQESEQESASAFHAYVERARALVAALKDTKAQRTNAHQKAKAQKEADINERSEQKAELASQKKLLEETTKAAKELAKSWAETSQTHTAEMSGIAKAVEFLTGQQKVGAGTTSTSTAASLLQVTASVSNKKEKPAYESGFKTIKWAIDDMIKTHQTTIAENKEHQESCKATLTGANQVAAQKAAALAAIKAAIADTQAAVDAAKKKRDEADQTKKDTETESTNSQIAWVKADKSREVEISQLDESVKLIGGAAKSLGDAGSERFQDVLAILDMIKSECAAELKNVSSAKLEEQNAWSVEKQQLTDLIANLQDQITTFDREITGGQKEKAALESKLKKKQGEAPETTDACKNFLALFQSGQDALTTKIEDLGSAKAHLQSWTEASDSANASYAAEVAFEGETPKSSVGGGMEEDR